MITAIDTNVLLDILIPNEIFRKSSSLALEEAATEGLLVICGLVYAELCVHFNTQQECDRFLEDNGILVQSLNQASNFLASRAWREYRKSGGKRDRILPDFLIGAHAQQQATRLLSRDRGFYRAHFPALKVLKSSAHNH